ncbi:hypothetical protein [Vibrio sp. TRT 17S01]|uniref:hypothetical protein n=1 Tax=Vibrio sp. TRT 17S01 TaxID=3418505 RepID=UPI003CF8FFDE
MKQSKTDLYMQLQNCCDWLVSSCTAFDNHCLSEAKRLATTLRVLLHDTDRSKSLLSQLKARNNARFLSTSTPSIKDNLLYGHNNLVIVKYDQDIEAITFYAPKADCSDKKWLRFEEWWNETVLTTDNDEYEFNRREIIGYLANKDGGAHVDPKLPAKYAALSKLRGMGYFQNIDGSPTIVQRVLPKDPTDKAAIDALYEKYDPVLGVELHTIRQITYEVLTTIKKKFPHIIIDEKFI